MDTRNDQIQAGWSAYGRDGEKIGDIEEVGQNYFIVTKGLIFTTDVFVPFSAIEELEANDGRVYLNVDKAEVDGMGWGEPPTATAGLSADTATGAVGGLGYTGRDTSADTTSGSYAATEQTTEGVGYTGAEATDERIRVPVHEEELRAERRQESAGEVRIEKDVIEEQRTLDVPVTREEVEVRRVAVNREATGDETAFTEGDTIRVPVMAETVEVTTQPRVVEELEISKRQVTDTQRVGGTVRREEVHVADDAGGVLAGTGASSISGAGDEMRDTGVSGSSRSTFDGDDATEAGGAAAGAIGGAAVGGVVGGPPGAVIGGAIGAAGGALAGDKVDGDESDDRDDFSGR